MLSHEQVVLAVFIVSFILILSESTHRTIAAWFGSTVMLLYGHATGVFHLHEVYDSAGELVKTYSLEHTMLGWIEFEVIGLLLGMILLPDNLLSGPTGGSAGARKVPGSKEPVHSRRRGHQPKGCKPLG